MSKAKVDEYKNYKKNKKKILKKEKRNKMIASIVGKLILFAAIAAVLVFISIKGVGAYREYLDGRPNYNTQNYILGDLSGINASEEETEEETKAEDTTAEETTNTEETTSENTEKQE